MKHFFITCVFTLIFLGMRMQGNEFVEEEQPEKKINYIIAINNEEKLWYKDANEADFAYSVLCEVNLKDEITLKEYYSFEPINSGDLETVKQEVENRAKVLYASSFEKPIRKATVSSRYGARWGRQHEGLDLASEIGTQIYASQAGTVTFAGECGNYGNLVVVTHRFGYQTYYAHCSEILVKIDDKVKQGDLIAEVGNTGRSTGPHLHFEVRLNGKALNPENYINN